MKDVYFYIVYRVHEYFHKRNPIRSDQNTILFMSMFTGSLFLPVLFYLRSFVLYPENSNPSSYGLRRIFGLIAAIVLYFINNLLIRKKLQGEQLQILKGKYYRGKYIIPIWLIFIFPVILCFGPPIIYGLINGTLQSPLLDKLMHH
jgi:hypothetical protein